MNIEVNKTLLIKAIEHLEIAQKEFFTIETDFIIMELKKAIESKPTNNKNLLLDFYEHLCKNDPLPINESSKEREVERFLKNNPN